MSDRHIKASKFLSRILRHEPEKVGVTLTKDGWVSIDTLLAAIAVHGKPLSRADLDKIVHLSEKKRFAISDDGLRIRASQGHSAKGVAITFDRQCPPEALYHGTIPSLLTPIREKGLLKMGRHHVHLSPDAETARTVGARRGKPAILTVRAGEMERDGYEFFLSDNGVWLIDHVPPQYLEMPNLPTLEDV